MKNKKAVITVSIIALLLMVASVIASTDNAMEDPQVGVAEAEVAGQLTPNGDRVVAKVNGENILAKDYLGSVEKSRYGTEYLKANVGKDTFTAYDEKWLKMRDDYSPEEIGLGCQILDAAEYGEAKKIGLDISLEEARSFIKKNRQIAEEDGFQLSEPYQEIINEIGEDAYWNEFAARAAQKNNSIGALQQNIIEQADSVEEGYQLLRDYQTKLIKEAQVEIIDEELLANLSVEKAKEYIISFTNLTM
ncbi:MAG: hypothetical protein GX318_06990 [Clostridia bacterium]|nr:hypothetical protein [Clostridia bacterium]